mgnify:CR=1 FL=1
MTTTPAQHTPGPWAIHWTGRNVTSGKRPSIAAGDTPNVVAANGTDQHYIAQMWQNENGRGALEANARLIAAAPEMLALLRHFVKYGHTLNAKSAAMDEARALLARIEATP